MVAEIQNFVDVAVLKIYRKSLVGVLQWLS